MQDLTLACNNIALEKTKACEENIKLKEQNTKLVDLIHKFEKKVYIHYMGKHPKRRSRIWKRRDQF